MNKREALSRVALFSRLKEKHLEKLADLSVPKTFPVDTLLIKEGTVGLGMFIITSGRVEVYRGEGDSRTTLAVLESGTIVGEMSLVNDEYRSANVRALEQTECLLVSKDAFNTLIHQEPDVALCVMSVLADRMRDSQNKIQELQNKVNETVAEVKEKVSQDWTAEGSAGIAPETSRRERDASQCGNVYEAAAETSRRVREPIQHMMEAQRMAVSAGSEFMNTWMGMMGSFLGGMARIADATTGAARTGFRETTATMPRRFFKSVTTAIDEGVRAYEDVVTGSSPTDEAKHV
jgi:CRP/FNR family transcriptional regulator, cyclic AMP receptor protein